MKVNYKKLKETVKKPSLGSEYAGAWDVYADEIEVQSHGRVWIKLNLAVEVPEGYRLMMQPRSSITKSTYMLQNSIGLIDADYRGGIQARFITPFIEGLTMGNFLYPRFPHAEGERIGQVYLEKIIPIEWNEVDELSETVRGTGGHGSSGNL